jgi:hypothetical protein
MTIRQQVPNNKGCNKINLSSETARMAEIPTNWWVLKAGGGKKFRRWIMCVVFTIEKVVNALSIIIADRVSCLENGFFLSKLKS